MPKFYYPLTAAIFLSGIVLFIESCRKMDRVHSTSQTLSITETKFFNNHRSVDATEKAIVDFLIRRNDSSHFVANTIKRIGYPRWNKAITIETGNNTHNQIESENNNGSVTYIPFVRDSQNYVNATMAVYTSAADTSFSYISDWQYVDYGFAAQPDSTDAKDIFHLFTRLDNAVFGTAAFKVTDHRLLTTTEKQRIIQWGKDPDSVEVYYELKNAENGTVNELLTPVETCTLYDVTVTFECPPGGGGGGCGCLPFRIAATSTETEPCWFTYQYEECTTTWVSSGGGGAGPGDGNPGNGGGDTPPGDEPLDCEGLSGRLLDPCSGGWEPIPTDDPPPNPNQGIIDSLQGYPCAQALLAQMPGLNTQVNQLLSTYLQSTQQVDIKFRVNPSLSGTLTSGQTLDIKIINGVVTSIVELNPDILNRGTKEYILLTFLHESIHAYMDYQWHLLQTDQIDTAAFVSKFPIYWDYRRVLGVGSTELAHHMQMSETYIGFMSNMLLSFNPNISNTTARYLAWEGLRETTLWFNNIADTNAVNNRISIARDTTGNYGNINMYGFSKCP